MNIIENKDIRRRLKESFPQYFINNNFEFIVYPPKNTFFRLEFVRIEAELIAKILEYCSREACKSGNGKSKKYHFNGINSFIGKDFSQEDMELIYTYLGNGINHYRTLQFIESGYDLNFLKEDY